LPAVVGDPEIKPVGLRLNPAGSEPDTMLKVAGVCPPDVNNCEEYACPAAAAGRGEEVTMVRIRQRIATVLVAGVGPHVPDCVLAVTVYIPGFIYI